MSEDTKPADSAEAPKDQAKIEKLTRKTSTTKPELPANVVITERHDGSVLFNAVAKAAE